MLIAKELNSKYVVADCKALFPNTSFPDNGPSAEWLELNGCYPVKQFVPHDHATEMLVDAEPYLDGGIVYTVAIAEKLITPTIEIIDTSNHD